MNIEKYTEPRAASSSLRNHSPCATGTSSSRRCICSKVLLDDSEGLAGGGGLIDRAGGNSRAILKATEEALK